MAEYDRFRINYPGPLRTIWYCARYGGAWIEHLRPVITDRVSGTSFRATQDEDDAWDALNSACMNSHTAGEIKRHKAKLVEATKAAAHFLALAMVERRAGDATSWETFASMEDEDWQRYWARFWRPKLR